VELREQVNWKQEELAGLDGRWRPSLGGASRISREAYVRLYRRFFVCVDLAAFQAMPDPHCRFKFGDRVLMLPS
jgi:hypothetical protein